MANNELSPSLAITLSNYLSKKKEDILTEFYFHQKQLGQLPI